MHRRNKTMASRRKRGRMTTDISKGFGAMISLNLALNEYKMNDEQKAKSKQYRQEIEEIMNRHEQQAESEEGEQ